MMGGESIEVGVTVVIVGLAVGFTEGVRDEGRRDEEEEGVRRSRREKTDFHTSDNRLSYSAR